MNICIYAKSVIAICETPHRGCIPHSYWLGDRPFISDCSYFNIRALSAVDAGSRHTFELADVFSKTVHAAAPLDIFGRPLFRFVS